MEGPGRGAQQELGRLSCVGIAGRVLVRMRLDITVGALCGGEQSPCRRQTSMLLSRWPRTQRACAVETRLRYFAGLISTMRHLFHTPLDYQSESHCPLGLQEQ